MLQCPRMTSAGVLIGAAWFIGLPSVLDDVEVPSETPQTEQDGSSSARARFERDVTAFAAARDGWVQTLVEVELDGDPELERTAQVCTTEHRSTWLIEDPGTGKRWSHAHESWGIASLCPVAAPTEAVAWSEPMNHLELSDVGPGEHHAVTLGVRDGELVLASRRRSSAGRGGAVAFEAETRWDIASVRAKIENAQRTATLHREGRIISVGAQAVEIAGPDLVHGWHTGWTGPEDASLLVSARVKTEGTVTLELRAIDDERMPLGAQAGRTDAYEIWWAAAGHDFADLFGRRNTSRGLRIEATVAGPRAQWLTTTSDPIPAISGTFDALEVTLSGGAIPADATWSVPATVVYVDADSDGSTTRIATSQVEPGRPGTYGILQHVPGGRTHPAVGEPWK